MSKLNYRQFTLPILATLAKNTIEFVQKSGLEAILQNDLFLELLERFEAFIKVVTMDFSAQMQNTLEEADKRRDKIYKACIDALNSKIVFGGEEGAAAEALLKIFKSKDSALYINRTRESVIINAIILELSTTKNRTLTEIAGMINQFDALKDAQRYFESQLNEKYEIESGLKQVETGTELRPGLEEALRAFFGYVTLMRNKPPWKDIYHDLERIKMAARNAER